MLPRKQALTQCGSHNQEILQPCEIGKKEEEEEEEKRRKSTPILRDTVVTQGEAMQVILVQESAALSFVPRFVKVLNTLVIAPGPSF